MSKGSIFQAFFFFFFGVPRRVPVPVRVRN